VLENKQSKSDVPSEVSTENKITAEVKVTSEAKDSEKSNGSSGENTSTKEEPAKTPKDNSRPVSSTAVPGTPWCVVWTGDDRAFFFNPSQRLSVWEKPEELKGRADVDRLLEKQPAAANPGKLGRSEGNPSSGSIDSDSGETASKKPRLDGEENQPQDNEAQKNHTPENADAETEKPANTPDKIPVGMEAAREAEERAARERAVQPLEVRVRRFREMLVEMQVSAFSTWEKELHKIVFDPRYLLLASKERKQTFEAYVKERAEEERREKKNKLKERKEKFSELLEEAELTSKSSFTEFSTKYAKDERFKGIEKSRDRESMFQDHLAELRKREKDEKHREKEKVKSDFLSLLKETKGLSRHSHWSEVKRKIDADPRYKAVDSSSRREDWFRDFVRKLDENPPSRESSDSRKEREKKERQEASIREREKEVKEALSSSLREREKEREQQLHAEQEENFRTLLSEFVRDPGMTWKEAKKVLRKDSRWELVSDVLQRSERDEMFKEHLSNLSKKSRESKTVSDTDSKEKRFISADLDERNTETNEMDVGAVVFCSMCALEAPGDSDSPKIRVHNNFCGWKTGSSHRMLHCPRCAYVNRPVLMVWRVRLVSLYRSCCVWGFVGDVWLSNLSALRLEEPPHGYLGSRSDFRTQIRGPLVSTVTDGANDLPMETYQKATSCKHWINVSGPDRSTVENRVSVFGAYGYLVNPASWLSIGIEVVAQYLDRPFSVHQKPPDVTILPVFLELQLNGLLQRQNWLPLRTLAGFIFIKPIRRGDSFLMVRQFRQIKLYQRMSPEMLAEFLYQVSRSYDNRRSMREVDERVVTVVPPNRSSLDAILDRLEDAPHAPSAAIHIEDSLLLNFDPLLERPKVPEPVCDCEPSNRAVPLNTSNTMTMVDRISPTPDEQPSPRPTNVDIVKISSDAPSPSSHIPPLASGVAASVTFSPWMHHSILDQALGGSDRSPEWHVSLPAEIVGSSATSVKGHLLAHSTECLTNINGTSEPSISPNSVPIPADVADMDALAVLLGRVNVQDPSVRRADQPSDDGLHTMTTSASLHTASPHDNAGRTPHTKSVNTPSSRFEVIRKLSQTFAPSLAPQSSSQSNTPSSMHVPHDTAKLHRSHLTESAPVDPSCSTTPKLNVSSRLSFGSISGMVTQVARSLYDRLGGVSGLSAATRTPTQADVGTNASPVARASAHMLEETETAPSVFPTSAHDSASGAKMFPAVNPVPSTCTSFAQSGDEDVWESVDSMNDPKPSITDGFTKSISAFDQVVDIVSENKENLQFLPTNADALLSGFHESWIVGNQANPQLLAADVTSLSATTHGNLHMTQLIHGLSASADTASGLQNSSLSDRQSDIAQEWMDLHDEVSRLRSVADDLSGLMVTYERALLDADAYLHRCNTAAVARLTRLAQERDEAVEQVANMHKACEYMVRGIQRAKETIETKKEKQAAAIRLLEKFEKKYPKMVTRTEKIVEHFTTHLGDALAENQRQQEADLRKLDKLRFDLRQAELRETAVAEQIKQLEKQSAELTRICQQFFP
ncbi:transcription elongation regulator, partial [Clonorchis sinensis]